MTSPDEKAAPGKSGDLERQAGELATSLPSSEPRYSTFLPGTPIYNPDLPLLENLTETGRNIVLAYGPVYVRHAHRLGVLPECTRPHLDGIGADLEAMITEALPKPLPALESLPACCQAAAMAAVAWNDRQLSDLQRKAVAINRLNVAQTGGLDFAQLSERRGDQNKADSTRARWEQVGL